MSSILTQKAKLELLLRMLIKSDSSNVLLNIRLLSFFAFKSLLIQKLTGCLKNRHMIYLETNILRYIIANMPAALYRCALTLNATGQCAIAMIYLNRAIYLGHLPSHALKAWMLIHGRKGVASDSNLAFELVENGTRLGCHHCQGVMALYYSRSCGYRIDEARSLELARNSSRKGSRYGQYALGKLYRYGGGGRKYDVAKAVVLYRLAAAQGLDEAQYMLGDMYSIGFVVVQDFAEALRLYQLAAAQGHPEALYDVARCHEHGWGVAVDVVEAIRWYRRAQAAGYSQAAVQLQRLRALE
jgi:TPR repeat protein